MIEIHWIQLSSDISMDQVSLREASFLTGFVFQKLTSQDQLVILEDSKLWRVDVHITKSRPFSERLVRRHICWGQWSYLVIDQIIIDQELHNDQLLIIPLRDQNSMKEISYTLSWSSSDFSLQRVNLFHRKIALKNINSNEVSPKEKPFKLALFCRTSLKEKFFKLQCGGWHWTINVRRSNLAPWWTVAQKECARSLVVQPESGSSFQQMVEPDFSMCWLRSFWNNLGDTYIRS